MGFDFSSLRQDQIVTLVAGTALAIAALLYQSVKNKRTPPSEEPPAEAQEPPKRAEAKTEGCLTTLLAILYVPLSLLSLSLAIFTDYIPSTVWGHLLTYTSLFCHLSVAAFSIACITASITWAREGKTERAFAVQFLPLGIFVLGLLLRLLALLTAF